ncbi:MAG: tricorn protease [Solirubrobacterales bacterium]|jgi:dipeptidyl aminopeptidase/acylaminoacyl peptidase|nr:tricorn protease [Solirubrobacterales bacterium]
MLNRSIYTALLVLLALAIPATASAASSRTGAVIFSQVKSEGGGIAKGGLVAAKEGHLNQLTENPADSEPAFSPDGRTIVFARGGDVYSVRADGSGERVLTSGPAVDGRPIFSPNGRIVVFERRTAEGAPRDLYTVGANGGSPHALTTTPADEHEASISDDGCMIAFVRSVALAGGGTADDVYSIRPAGIRLRRLTHTPGLDEFAPHYFGDENIVFSRGQSGEGPDAYADIYTMRENGTHVSPLVHGAGSAFVEDVAPVGHTLLFRRDQGLWVKPLGPGRAHKLSELPDGAKTNAVFSSDGGSVAAFVASEEAESLSAIDVGSGRRADLAEGFDFSDKESGTTIGPVIAWQPVNSGR